MPACLLCVCGGGWVCVCVCGCVGVNLLKHVTHASMHAICCCGQQHGCSCNSMVEEQRAGMQSTKLCSTVCVLPRARMRAVVPPCGCMAARPPWPQCSKQRHGSDRVQAFRALNPRLPPRTGLKVLALPPLTWLPDRLAVTAESSRAYSCGQAAPGDVIGRSARARQHHLAPQRCRPCWFNQVEATDGSRLS